MCHINISRNVTEHLNYNNGSLQQENVLHRNIAITIKVMFVIGY